MKNQHLPEKIQGTRIHLKVHDPALAQTMFDCIQRDRDRLLRFLPWPAFINTVQDELDFIEKSKTAFNQFESAGYALLRIEDNSFIGAIGSFKLDWANESFEIGYWLLSAYEGKGYMREAVSLLLEEHRKVGFHRAVIMCESENHRSKAIPMNLGFEYEGKLRDCRKDSDGYRSLEVYSKLLQGKSGELNEISNDKQKQTR